MTGEDVSNCVLDVIEKNRGQWFRITYDIKQHNGGTMECQNFAITPLIESNVDQPGVEK